MSPCSVCGEETVPAFACNYCESEHCEEHRLPENHDCPSFTGEATTPGLEGEGPQTRDRRSTHRRRVERVRKKETETWESRTPEPQRGPTEEATQEKETSLFTCPACGSNTDQLKSCSRCADHYCPDCVVPDVHGCQTEPESDTADEPDGLFGALGKLLRF
jgi:predicted nucleic acid binding AN1-type Zn finger protein